MTSFRAASWKQVVCICLLRTVGASVTRCFQREVAQFLKKWPKKFQNNWFLGLSKSFIQLPNFARTQSVSDYPIVAKISQQWPKLATNRPIRSPWRCSQQFWKLDFAQKLKKTGKPEIRNFFSRRVQKNRKNRTATNSNYQQCLIFLQYYSH